MKFVVSKPVFQMYPSRGHITVQDARDVYNLCQTMYDPKVKEALYAMHGMDGPAVEKYLPIIESLYLSYHMPSYRKPSYHKVIEKKEAATENIWEKLYRFTPVPFFQIWI